MESFFFQISYFFFRIIGQKPKNFKTRECVMYYKIISIDSTQKALQINGKLFFQISESFFDQITIYKIIVTLGLCKRGGGGICAEQHAF